MRPISLITSLAFSAIVLAACSPGSQTVTPPPANGTVQQITASSSRSPSGEEDVPVDRHHIFYPTVGQQNAASHLSSPANNLLYNGGSVMNSPQVYVVLWGWQSESSTCSTNKYSTDPNCEYPYLYAFLNGVGGSSWLNTVTQ